MPTMIVQQAQYSNRLIRFSSFKGRIRFSSFKGRRKTADWPIWGKEDMPVKKKIWQICQLDLPTSLQWYNHNWIQGVNKTYNKKSRSATTKSRPARSPFCRNWFLFLSPTDWTDFSNLQPVADGDWRYVCDIASDWRYVCDIASDQVVSVTCSCS